MSAEEMYSERGATGRRIDDSYTTRPLPLHEITDHPTDLPLIGAPEAARRTMGQKTLPGPFGLGPIENTHHHSLLVCLAVP